MSIYFVTFADSRYKPTIDRIYKEVDAMKVFDKICTLSNHDFDDTYKKLFYNEHRDKAIGFGYWCWKSWAIKTILDRIEANDYLVYCDAGCTLQTKGISRLKEYLNLISSEKDIIVFEQEWKEKQYDTEDLFSYYQVPVDDEIRDKFQFFAGVLIIRKTSNSINLINAWFNTCNLHYDIISNENPKLKNSKYFVLPRYDQSALSILLHKYRTKIVLNISEILKTKHDMNENKPILVVHKKKYTTRQNVKYFPIKCMNVLWKLLFNKQLIIRRK